MAMNKKICAECFFEEGHSQKCSRYVDNIKALSGDYKTLHCPAHVPCLDCVNVIINKLSSPTVVEGK